MKYNILPLIMAAALAACSSASAPARDGSATQSSSKSAPRTDTVSIRLGQSAVVDGALDIRFDARVGDSRCPANAVCVWQGDAHAKIVTRVSGGSATSSDLHSTLEPTKVVAGRYTISMIGLTPYPGTGRDTETPVLILRVSSQ
jgi:hypothetical protein